MDVIIFHFGPSFALLPSSKNQNFRKMKKTPGDIITLYKCTKNQNHMLYCLWDVVCDRCNCYFSFGAIFCPFTPLTAQKIKILKEWKKCLEISSFYNSVPKIMIICYTGPEIWCVTDVIIFYFRPVFALLPPWQPAKSKFLKNESNAWRYHHFTQVYQKPWSYAILFLRYGVSQM